MLWAYLCVVVGHLAEQVVCHVGVSNVVEKDVQEAIAAAAHSKGMRTEAETYI